MNQTPTPPSPPTPPPPASDPMFQTLEKSRQADKAKLKSSGGVSSWLIPSLLLVAVLGLLAYNIYLHMELNVQRDQVLELVDGIAATDNRIDQVEENLYKTGDNLAQEINRASKELTDLDQRQTRKAKELEQNVQRKADREDVADVEMRTANLTADVGNLKTEVNEVDSEVKTVDTKVEDLSTKVETQAKTLDEQKALIESNMTNINANKNILDETRDSLLNLKTSLDRNYFVFQMHKKSGLIRVSDIGLRLKKTKDSKQEFEVEIFYDDKKMKKKGVGNVPINFYKIGYRKHYELVITKVEKDNVNGYLSTPKVKE